MIFSTYQSIGAIYAAQEPACEPFDLVICDEAHRTTGVTLAGEDESHFVRVHDPEYIRASRRALHDGDAAALRRREPRRKAEEDDAVICSMDDEALYGPELHRLGFGEAVERGCSPTTRCSSSRSRRQYVARSSNTSSRTGTPSSASTTRPRSSGAGTGCRDVSENADGKRSAVEPMRRAVAFSRSIKDSKRITAMFEDRHAYARRPDDDHSAQCVATTLTVPSTRSGATRSSTG